MLKHAPAIIWTIALYTATALTAGLSVGPSLAPQATIAQASAASFWFETNHAVLHAATFAVLIFAVVAGNRGVGANHSMAALSILIALGVGVGQEALQSALRGRLALGNSAFDLLCDVGGALIALGVLLRTRPQPNTPAL